MKTMPFDIIVGEKYSNTVTIRLVTGVSVRNNLIEFIEEPDRYRKSGFCSIDDFYTWMDQFK